MGTQCKKLLFIFVARFTLNHLDMKIHMLSPEATLNTCKDYYQLKLLVETKFVLQFIVS